MGELRAKIEVSPEVTRQLATRKALGASLRELEKEFGLSRPVINRTLSTDLARAIQKEIQESAVAGAVASVKRQLADMTELAMEALKHNLTEKKIEAVKLYFAALGMDSQEKEKGGTTQAIQVILPGAVAPKEIKDVENIPEES